MHGYSYQPLADSVSTEDRLLKMKPIILLDSILGADMLPVAPTAERTWNVMVILLAQEAL